jgi:hypothetical protein
MNKIQNHMNNTKPKAQPTRERAINNDDLNCVLAAMVEESLLGAHDPRLLSSADERFIGQVKAFFIRGFRLGVAFAGQRENGHLDAQIARQAEPETECPPPPQRTRRSALPSDPSTEEDEASPPRGRKEVAAPLPRRSSAGNMGD